MLTGLILLQLIVILTIVQLFGNLCRHISQQWVIGEILAGLVLGPSFLGAFLPGITRILFPISALPTLQTLGDLGLVLYMFSLGASLDIRPMFRQAGTMTALSLSNVLLPLGMGAGLAFFLFHDFAGLKANRVTFTLLVGAAMSITAFPVLARILSEKNMLGTRCGILALTSAAIDDVIAWCLLGLVTAIIHAQGWLSGILTIGLTLLFIVCMLTIVRPLFIYLTRHNRSKELSVTLCVVLTLLSAYTTNALGIHPAFGAFMMGLILPQEVLFTDLIRAIEKVNTMLFLPLYFVYSGLHTQIGLINTPRLWLICLLVLGTACIGKLIGNMFVTRCVGESWHTSLSLCVLLNTRGLVELIVLNIGLDLGVLSPTLFSMLVIMALVTTMMTSPLLSLLNKPAKLTPLSERYQSEQPDPGKIQ
jgi:Kef-type K+ transport system membrane component KefB